ncbi:hypothetical protein OSB04_031479 [Centaurea solstitialis]|uniref:Tf2-1-like SH3-like domain-containing protein n=1 Tax=Centaurea solstitialis TaxID=347529 RepID=A0AA38W856_9ASTR|nr:hypothetical protein OSB04_031479 [Centaurea solstitialis]
MEMEQRTPLMAKKLWSIIRAILYMAKKGYSKSIIPWLELHMMIIKRSGKIAGKAIGNLLLDHHQTLTCRPNHIHTTFISPHEYQFSCNETPIFYHKRKNNRHRDLAGDRRRGGLYRRSHKDHELTVDNVKRVFDILNDYETAPAPEKWPESSPEKSPLTVLGFGGSPCVRQLRVTDSPFPVDNTAEDGGMVDRAADEFIRNFYNELMQQKRRAAVEPPSRTAGLGAPAGDCSVRRLDQVDEKKVADKVLCMDLVERVAFNVKDFMHKAMNSLGYRDLALGDDVVQGYAIELMTCYAKVEMTFSIIKRVGEAVNKLELPEELRSIHNTFLVSNLRKGVTIECSAIPLKDVQVEEKLKYIEEP